MYLALYHQHVPLVLRPIDEPFTVDQEDSLFYVRILDRTINSKREHVDDVNELLSTAQSCQGLIPHRQQQICIGAFFNVHDTSDIRPSILSDSLLKAKADLASSFHNVRYSPSHYLFLAECFINGVSQMPFASLVQWFSFLYNGILSEERCRISLLDLEQQSPTLPTSRPAGDLILSLRKTRQKSRLCYTHYVTKLSLGSLCKHV